VTATATARWRDHLVVTRLGRAPRVYAPEGARVHPAVELDLVLCACAGAALGVTAARLAMTDAPLPAPSCAPCLPTDGDVPPEVRDALDEVGATLDRMDARCVLLPERDRIAVVPTRRTP